MLQLLGNFNIPIAVSIIALAVAASLNLFRHGSVISGVTRGDGSWSYFYVTLGFALAIEGVIVALFEPLRWPSKLIVLAVVTLFTIRLWLNGWFQNKLMGWKAAYEQRQRHPHYPPYFETVLFLVALYWIVSTYWVTSVPAPQGESGNYIHDVLESPC